MFDISFAELMLVAVVGLLVIGPEKLPKVARTLGAYTGRMQRYISQVKEEVNREVRFEELQALQQEIKDGAAAVKSSILDGERQIQHTVEEVAGDLTLERSAATTKKSRAKKKTPTTKKTRIAKSKAKSSSTKAAS